ncbi:hypothetical protein UCD39_22110 [Nitrospirillum sp. BR 11752]|nr:hypothetical protein [Nitrospirillum sp. BR 11752]
MNKLFAQVTGTAAKAAPAQARPAVANPPLANPQVAAPPWPASSCATWW